MGERVIDEWMGQWVVGDGWIDGDLQSSGIEFVTAETEDLILAPSLGHRSPDHQAG